MSVRLRRLGGRVEIGAIGLEWWLHREYQIYLHIAKRVVCVDRNDHGWPVLSAWIVRPCECAGCVHERRVGKHGS